MPDGCPKVHEVVGEFAELGCSKIGNRLLEIVSPVPLAAEPAAVPFSEEDIPFYPRGFPYSKRWSSDEISTNSSKVKVVLNAGLWLGDPDIDAITRLCKPINAIKYKKTYGDTFALENGTWCPINTQNTSYSRDIIPASFVPPNVGRYDDIWSGYLLRKITDHFESVVVQ